MAMQVSVMQPEMTTQDTHSADASALSWPSSASENWKFTPLDKLELSRFTPVSHKASMGGDAQNQNSLCFDNGFLVSQPVLEAAVQISRLTSEDPALKNWLSYLPEGHHLSHLLAANLGDIILITVEDGATIEAPVHLDYTGSETEHASHPLVLISVGKAAECRVVEHYHSENGLSAPVLIAELAEDARMHIAKLQEEAAATTHLGLSVYKLASRAYVNGFTLSTGAKLARSEAHLHFADKDAQMSLNAIYLGANEQHHDITTVTHHAHPSCASNQVIRGVLADQSHGVFQGKVCVAPDAQKTDGQQMSRVLLLSRDAVADAKPELEIFADDVVCSHGATVGELDEVLMFYLKSRGIHDDEARAMLIQAFLADALDEIEDEALKTLLTHHVDRWTSGYQSA